MVAEDNHITAGSLNDNAGSFLASAHHTKHGGKPRGENFAVWFHSGPVDTQDKPISILINNMDGRIQ